MDVCPEEGLSVDTSRVVDTPLHKSTSRQASVHETPNAEARGCVHGRRTPPAGGWSRRQPRLFDAPPPLPVVWLPPDVQVQLRHALVQWMQAVAKRLPAEGGDEQDHR